MKIRLAIIDQDENYVKRLVNNLQINYADKIEPYYFSSLDNFNDFKVNNTVHVVLASENIKMEAKDIPERVSFAYLVSSKDIEELEGKPAICKFQKADLLYKNVLSLFADMESRMVLRGHNGKGKVILFTSAQGGAGTSSVASAFAIYKAKKGEQVLYLNLDKFYKPECIFKAEGNMSFSDAIYAVKSKRANLTIKLESAIKKDYRGVDFFDSCKNANDIFEMNAEEVTQLVNCLAGMENYQCILVDAPLDFSPTCRSLLEHCATEIVLINDGSTVGNDKLQRAFEIINIWEERNKGSIYPKCRLLYNRFSSTTGKKIMDIPFDTIGGINRIEGGTFEQRIDKLAEHQIMSQI